MNIIYYLPSVLMGRYLFFKIRECIYIYVYVPMYLRDKYNCITS